MYIWISRSASSWARYSSCATIRLATVSSMGVPRNTIRFFSRSEKMSYARSPRLVCSTTIGTAYETTRCNSSSLEGCLVAQGERYSVMARLMRCLDSPRPRSQAVLAVRDLVFQYRSSRCDLQAFRHPSCHHFVGCRWQAPAGG